MQQSRLFGIVYFLLDHRRASATELAHRFEVSVRTIYRDIDALSAVGIPVCAEPGRNGGISLLEGFTLDRSLISKAEQQQILFALQSVAATAQIDAASLIEKLGGLFGSAGTDWIEIDFCRWSEGSAERDRFSLLKNAILEKEIISFCYASTRGERSERRVKPARLVYKAREWYLQGFCLLRQEYRTFKINRMDLLQRTGEHFFEILCPPSIEEMVPDGQLVTVRLRFSPELAYRVYDEFDRSSLQIQEDGSLLITTVVNDGRWLYGYLLSFGSGVEVLAPDSIRRKIALEAERILCSARNADIPCQHLSGMMGSNKQEESNMEMKFCQSCGMPLGDPNLLGTEKDQSKSADYCSYCYQNGAFVAECTMEEMIEFCVQPMVDADPKMSAQKAKEMMSQFFPTLKRWNKN